MTTTETRVPIKPGTARRIGLRKPGGISLRHFVQAAILRAEAVTFEEVLGELDEQVRWTVVAQGLSADYRREVTADEARDIAHAEAASEYLALMVGGHGGPSGGTFTRTWS